MITFLNVFVRLWRTGAVVKALMKTASFIPVYVPRYKFGISTLKLLPTMIEWLERW